jgi:hypothetical protein
MAKKPNTPAAAGNGNPPAPVRNDVSHLFGADGHEPLVVRYGDTFKLDVSTLTGNPAALAYLLQNGYSQSMTDAAAFTKEQKAGKSEAEVAEMAHKARQARHDAIIAGTIGARVGGAKLPPVERVMREVAEERLKAIAVTRGVAMPKNVKGGAQTLTMALDKILSRDPDGIRAEAETRIASAKANASAIDDDDLFAPAPSAA